jgi:DNA gyrase/topoisomerase IV subunit A
VIYGYEGVREAFKTGRGRVVVRAKANFEEVDGRESIIVTEIPYQVKNAEMKWRLWKRMGIQIQQVLIRFIVPIDKGFL